MQACLDVFDAEGWSALSARRVCEVAGLTGRYFYESFESPDEPIAAIFVPLTQEISTVVKAPVDDEGRRTLPGPQYEPEPHRARRAGRPGRAAAQGPVLVAAQPAGGAVAPRHAELIANHPGRFSAFATLPVDGPDEALAELAYALDELRLDGVALTSNGHGRYVGDPSLEPVLAELARRRVPVFVHPEDCPYIEVLGLERPNSIVEFPFDTARTITNALYRRLPAVSGAAADPRALRRCIVHGRRPRRHPPMR